MLGSLTKLQCERILLGGMIGRLGCYSSGKVYVVPVTFVFEDGYIYAHSKEGLKIRMMRKNPKVCFQVDQVDNMSSWRSVILWGRFEEIDTAQDQEKAIRILVDRLQPFHTSESVKPSESQPNATPKKEKKPVLYRIHVDEISGRFEK